MTLIDRPAALVSGFPAAVLADVLTRALREDPQQLARLPDPQRAEVLAAVSDLRAAAAGWRQAVDAGAMSGNGHADIAGHAAGPQWLPAAITVEEAAEMLNLNPRQVRRLGPDLGAKVAGRWLFDPAAIAAELHRRTEDAAA